jgi:Tfp pilus assembly protein PilF
VYRRQGKLDQARELFEGLLKQRPNDVPAHIMVAILLQAQGQRDAARARFEKVLSLDPRSAIASNNLAYLDAESGTNLDVALNRAQAAIAAQPENPDFNDTLGWVYVRRGLPALAVAPLEQSIETEPKNALYRYHLGMAHLRLNDRERARAALQRALELSPNFENAADARQALASLGK